jgi:hypothetical protein
LGTRFELSSDTSPVSIMSSRYFQCSSARLRRSEYSSSPPAASTSSPDGSKSVVFCSDGGSAASERDAVTCRSRASTAICGPRVTAPTR